MTVEVVRVERAIGAPPDEVFAAWTDPESLRQWMAPDPMTVADAHCDPRVGGAYRIVMVGDSGAVEHTGEYEEVSPPHLLVFTWRSANTGGRTTRVRVELQPAAAGTLMVITHEGLPPGPPVDAHRQGWTSIAGNLDAITAGRAR